MDHFSRLRLRLWLLKIHIPVLMGFDLAGQARCRHILKYNLGYFSVWAHTKEILMLKFTRNEPIAGCTFTFVICSVVQMMLELEQSQKASIISPAVGVRTVLLLLSACSLQSVEI